MSRRFLSLLRPPKASHSSMVTAWSAAALAARTPAASASRASGDVRSGSAVQPTHAYTPGHGTGASGLGGRAHRPRWAGSSSLVYRSTAINQAGSSIARGRSPFLDRTQGFASDHSARSVEGVCLGILHADQNRYAEARAAYEEALTIQRELAKSNPETYRPAVATTLDNLGNLHRTQNRYPEARAAYDEAPRARSALKTRTGIVMANTPNRAHGPPPEPDGRP